MTDTTSDFLFGLFELADCLPRTILWPSLWFDTWGFLGETSTGAKTVTGALIDPRLLKPWASSESRMLLLWSEFSYSSSFYYWSSSLFSRVLNALNCTSDREESLCEICLCLESALRELPLEVGAPNSLRRNLESKAETLARAGISSPTVSTSSCLRCLMLFGEMLSSLVSITSISGMGISTTL